MVRFSKATDGLVLMLLSQMGLWIIIALYKYYYNIRNREVSFLIYLRTEALSVQKTES